MCRNTCGAVRMTLVDCRQTFRFTTLPRRGLWRCVIVCPGCNTNPKCQKREHSKSTSVSNWWNFSGQFYSIHIYIDINTYQKWPKDTVVLKLFPGVELGSQTSGVVLQSFGTDPNGKEGRTWCRSNFFPKIDMQRFQSWFPLWFLDIS